MIDCAADAVCGRAANQRSVRRVNSSVAGDDLSGESNSTSGALLRACGTGAGDDLSGESSSTSGALPRARGTGDRFAPGSAGTFPGTGVRVGIERADGFDD